jgi:hypothetical protein
MIKMKVKKIGMSYLIIGLIIVITLQIYFAISPPSCPECYDYELWITFGLPFTMWIIYLVGCGCPGISMIIYGTQREKSKGYYSHSADIVSNTGSGNATRFVKPIMRPQPAAKPMMRPQLIAKASIEPTENSSIENFPRCPNGGLCDVCSKPIRPFEAFIVPLNIFYQSDAYRSYLKTHSPLMVMGVVSNVETIIADMQSKDHSEGSAVCTDCIYMFQKNLIKEKYYETMRKKGFSQVSLAILESRVSRDLLDSFFNVRISEFNGMVQEYLPYRSYNKEIYFDTLLLEIHPSKWAEIRGLDQASIMGLARDAFVMRHKDISCANNVVILKAEQSQYGFEGIFCIIYHQPSLAQTSTLESRSTQQEEFRQNNEKKVENVTPSRGEEILVDEGTPVQKFVGSQETEDQERIIATPALATKPLLAKRPAIKPAGLSLGLPLDVIRKADDDIQERRYLNPSNTMRDKGMMENEKIQELVTNKKFTEPEAREILKLVEAMKAWYKQRADSYHGSFGGICDDCNGDIQKNNFYLTAACAICERCADNELVSIANWNDALPDVQRYFGGISVSLPREIISLSKQVQNNINALKMHQLAGEDLNSLKEIEIELGRTIPVIDKGELKYGAKIENGSVIELILTPLSLGENGNLTSIPEAITGLSNLKKLEIIRHKLSSMPDSIGNLSNLERLCLNWNNLTKIPDTIGRLQNLKSISLYNNKIDSIPDGFWELSHLEELILSDIDPESIITTS